MAPSRHDWKIVDWDIKPQHNQPTIWGQNLSLFQTIQKEKVWASSWENLSSGCWPGKTQTILHSYRD